MEAGLGDGRRSIWRKVFEDDVVDEKYRHDLQHIDIPFISRIRFPCERLYVRFSQME